MPLYVVRRLVHSAVVVFVVATIMFVLFRLAPADPTTLLVEAGATDAARQRLEEQWGLTGSLWEQYWRYLGSIIRGDFGNSFFYQEPAMAVLVPAIGNTLMIAVPGMLLGTIVGSLWGTWVGWSRRGGIIERAGVLVATVIRGTPDFILGIFLLMLFSTLLGWFPAFGMGDTGDGPGPFQYLTPSFLLHLALPVLALTIFFIPENMLLMRAGVLANRQEDYIDLVRAKGVREPTVARHAARNSLLPVVTWLLPALAETVGGIIILEVVFSWPGVGRELVLAINRQDYPVAQAAFFLLAVAIVVANFAADLLYPKIDPRVTYV